jgi:hypothetical protein
VLRALVTRRGRVLRALRHGAPTADCLFRDVQADGRSALKLWNANGAGGALLGAFNVQGAAWDRGRRRNAHTQSAGRSVLAALSPLDVPPLLEAAAAAAAAADADGAAGEAAPALSVAVWQHRAKTLSVLRVSAAELRARRDAPAAPAAPAVTLGERRPIERPAARRDGLLFGRRVGGGGGGGGGGGAAVEAAAASAGAPARGEASAPASEPAAERAAESAASGESGEGSRVQCGLEAEAEAEAERAAVVELVLEPGGWELFSLAAVHTLDAPAGRRGARQPRPHDGGGRGGGEGRTAAAAAGAAAAAAAASAGAEREVEWACIGLRALLNAGGAVLEVSLHRPTDPRATAALRRAAVGVRALRLRPPLQLQRAARAPPRRARAEQLRRWLAPLASGARRRARAKAVGLASVRGTGELLCLCTSRPLAVALVQRAPALDAQGQGDGEGAAEGGGRSPSWTHNARTGELVVWLPDEGPADADEPLWQLVVTL